MVVQKAANCAAFELCCIIQRSVSVVIINLNSMNKIIGTPVQQRHGLQAL